MNDVTEGLVRRRRSRAEAEKLVAEFESSGLTRKAFCAGRGLTVAALDSYRRQARPSAPGRMVPLEVLPVISALSAEQGRGDGLWLELANGRRIGVGSGFDATVLRRLLEVVEQA
jgi:hypothetical protein